MPTVHQGMGPGPHLHKADIPAARSKDATSGILKYFKGCSILNILETNILKHCFNNKPKAMKNNLNWTQG